MARIVASNVFGRLCLLGRLAQSLPPGRHPKARPEHCFDTLAVVVAYQGRQTTGGYSVEVTGIKRSGTVLAISVGERRPTSGDVTTQALTSPFVAVSIPRPPNGATVRFADERGAAQAPQR